MTEQQYFVAGACHFRDENGVVVLFSSLSLTAVIAVHGVPELVRDGENVVRRLFVVEQNVRVNAVHAHGISAAALSGRFVHVHPTLVVSSLQQSLIFLAQRLQAFLDQSESLVEFKREVCRGNHGIIQVVHIESFKPHDLFSQSHVFVQHGKRFVYAVDEVVVNFSVNLLVEQRFFYGAAEFARLCKEAVLSYAAAVKTCNGVYFPFVGFVPGFKRLFSDLLRGVLHEHTVTSVRERNRLAVHLDGSPIHFAVVQPAEGFAEISRHFARVCEQLFRLGGKHVRFSRFDSAQGIIVFFELRLCHDFVQSLFVKPAKLGLHERGGD